VERHRWSRFRVDDQSFGIRARHFGRYGCPMTRTENGATINAMERRNSLRLVVIVAISAIAVGLQAADEQNADYTVRILALPDHGQANITMDYIAYDPKTGYVWVPAINIGSVDVVDTSNGRVREISGFATKELEFRGRKRAQGPSGVSIGDGVVYVGDRADSSVCAIDERTLARKTCGHIDSTPDGVVYVAPIKEVWVTAPSDNSVRILDSQTLSQKEKLTFEGRPEGYAVDAKRGRFYMNYEDKDLTTGIDLKTHKTVRSGNRRVGRAARMVCQWIKTRATCSLPAARGRRSWMQVTTGRSCHPSTPATAWMISTTRQPLALCT
jgi:hypothetical protein